MKRKIPLVLLLLLLFIGCDNFYRICSLNPFYIEKNIILSPAIEGSWLANPAKSLKDSASSSNSEIWSLSDSTSTWTIKRSISRFVIKNKKGEDSTTFRPENYYIVKLIPQTDSVKYEFKVVLFQVNKGLYADFIPITKDELIKSKLASNSFLEVHTLARITLQKGEMQLSWLGADCMKEMIEKKRVRINYQWVKEVNRFLLTANSEDLTKMIDRYADQPRFIKWDDQQAKINLIPIN